MTNSANYLTLLKQLLKYTEKIERYRHHIVFVSTYLELKCIPKGFRLKVHTNIEELNLDTILQNCSKKVMLKTVGCFKNKLKSALDVFNNMNTKITERFPDKIVETNTKKDKRTENKRNNLSTRREKKFVRDGLKLEKAKDLSQKYMQSLIEQNVIPIPSEILKNEILSEVVIPPYDPINLDAKKRDLPPGLSELCKKGPSFIPTPMSFDWLQLQKDFDSFRNNMRAQAFFSKKQSEQNVEVSGNSATVNPPKQKSTWKSPKSTIPEIETFLNSVERDLFSNNKRKKVDDNLPEVEREALDNWRRDHLYDADSDLIIRQQDKGNRFIIVDKQTDIRKTEEQIQRSSFERINHDPTLDHVEQVKNWAEKWHERKEINKLWKDFIIKDEVQPGKNTPLYKTHKTNTPVRLLTTGCNTAIENLSKFLEVHSAPLTTHLRSRIRDTSHLLETIDDINAKGIPDGTILVSFDVVNMFPNIDNERGIRTLQAAYDKRSVKNPSTKCLIEALRICLYCNNSVFNNTHLLQTNGTATGAPNSCSYSDLAVQPIDDAIFDEMESNFTELYYYGRYRDDCLIMWIGTEERLHELHNFINTLDADLKFTMEIGGDTINFLDLKISLIEGKLCTSVYSKPTDSHLYLQANSCHQKASIRGIQKGVSIRLRRICSSLEEYDIKSKEYTAYLIARGHHPTSVCAAFASARTLSIGDARTKVQREPSTKRVIFSTKYNPRGPNVNAIIKRHSHLLKNSQAVKEIFPNGVMVASKREKNLKELLTRADPYAIKIDVTDKTKHGYKRCKNRCDSCDCFVMETDTIKSTATGKTYVIRRDFNCKSEFIVYCAICVNCMAQGVGSTFEWKPRLANYKSHINKSLQTCGIVKHFLHKCVNVEDPIGYLVFVIIDGLNNTDNLTTEEIDDLLLEKEKFWIGTLVTQHSGMNCSHDWNRKKRCEKAPKN